MQELTGVWGNQYLHTVWMQNFLLEFIYTFVGAWSPQIGSFSYRICDFECQNIDFISSICSTFPSLDLPGMSVTHRHEEDDLAELLDTFAECWDDWFANDLRGTSAAVGAWVLGSGKRRRESERGREWGRKRDADVFSILIPASKYIGWEVARRHPFPAFWQEEEEERRRKEILQITPWVFL